MRIVSFCAIAVAAGFVGCATYQHKIKDAYDHLEAGRPDRAVMLLQPQAEAEGDDQLVYLLEYATALQQARQFKESDQAFLKAAKIAEIQDYHSLSRITGSLILSEGIMQYKGEPFEKVMIHVMLAINAAVIGDFENARVECRRIHQMLDKLKKESGLPFEQNPFARYLAALLWEADRSWDFSYLDYADAYKLNSQIGSLKANISYVARKAGRADDLSALGLPPIDRSEYAAREKSDHGELIFIYQQGQGPVKYPNPEFPRLPRLYSRTSRGKLAQISVLPAKEKSAGESSEASSPTGELEVDGAAMVKFMTERVFDLQDTAMRTLNDQYGAMVAKRIAGVAVKNAIAERVAEENRGLGALMWIGMNLADQADLRQWATLPESFQIGRLQLAPGTYRVQIDAIAPGVGSTGESAVFEDVLIRPRKKTFMNWRSFR